jgi:hypothetical protein
VATLSEHAAAPADDASRIDAVRPAAEGTPEAPTHAAHRAALRGARRRTSAPQSRVAYALGIATVCALAAVDLVAGGPAAPALASTQEQSASVTVADALGIAGTGVAEVATDDAQHLEELAASRSERDAEQAAAADSQAQAEQAVVAARAEAEARAAADAAAAAAAAAAAEAQTAAASAPAQAGTSAPISSPSTAATAVASISNSAGGVRAQAQAAADAVVSNVSGTDGITIGGTRASAADPGGHPSGLALDYMVGSNATLGDAIVEYHIAHWDELGVDYIIWQQRMLSSPSGSWSTMENRGSATANHMDHPHVNYQG